MESYNRMKNRFRNFVRVFSAIDLIFKFGVALIAMVFTNFVFGGPTMVLMLTSLALAFLFSKAMVGLMRLVFDQTDLKAKIESKEFNEKFSKIVIESILKLKILGGSQIKLLGVPVRAQALRFNSGIRATIGTEMVDGKPSMDAEVLATGVVYSIGRYALKPRNYSVETDILMDGIGIFFPVVFGIYMAFSGLPGSIEAALALVGLGMLGSLFATVYCRNVEKFALLQTIETMGLVNTRIYFKKTAESFPKRDRELVYRRPVLLRGHYRYSELLEYVDKWETAEII